MVVVYLRSQFNLVIFLTAIILILTFLNIIDIFDSSILYILYFIKKNGI